MRSRWLSTFTLLGGVLVVLGVVGKVVQLTGHRFVFDPGQVPDGNEGWYYIAVGALMILTGLVTPPAGEETPDNAPPLKKNNGRGPTQKPPAAPTVKPDVAGTAAVTAGDESG